MKLEERLNSRDRACLRENFPFAGEMAACPQDSLYHGEGDVWTHTMMVLDGVERRVAEHGLQDTRDETVLRLAALFHDCAKPETTVFEFCHKENRDRVKQPGHALKGGHKAWRTMIDAGFDPRLARDVCGLVLWHQRPSHILEQSNQHERICRFNAEGGNWNRLLLLCESDQSGRISPNVEDGLLSLMELREEIEKLSANMNADLINGEMPFSAEWRVLMGESYDSSPFHKPHQEYKARFSITSGLPGSGKSTWVRDNQDDATVVSLDQIRSEFKRYKRNQEYEGKCFQEAMSRTRQGLAHGKHVIWDSTNLDARSRSRLLRVARNYKAYTRIISFEDPADIAFERNRQREHAVPETVMRAMAENREVVLPNEAHELISVNNGMEMQFFPELETENPSLNIEVS